MGITHEIYDSYFRSRETRFALKIAGQAEWRALLGTALQHKGQAALAV